MKTSDPQPDSSTGQSTRSSAQTHEAVSTSREPPQAPSVGIPTSKRIRIDPVVPRLPGRPIKPKSRRRGWWSRQGTPTNRHNSNRASHPLSKASVIALIVMAAILLTSLIAYALDDAAKTTGSPDPGNSDPPKASVTIPAGAHRLGAGELDQACARIWGAGSKASYIANSGSVPAYWVRCNNDVNQGLGIEEYCQAVFKSHADNPYRFDTDSNKRPWDWWYCQPN